MKDSLKLLVAAILSPLAVVAAPSAANDVDREVRDTPRLIDPTCTKLNAVYKRMRELSFYRETIFELKSDGSLEEYLTVIFRRDYIYLKSANSNTWDRLEIPPIYWQTFTSCTSKMSSVAGLYFATYHRDGHLAGAEVWTTKDADKITKIVRRYPSDDLVLPFQTAVSMFEYRQEALSVPKEYTCGGGPCRY